jgi:hypothetical protein
MGKNTKRVEDFIDNIPDDKLSELPTSTGTCIWNDINFRLDMQGVSTQVVHHIVSRITYLHAYPDDKR